MTSIVGTPQIVADGGSYTAEAGSSRLLVYAKAKELTSVSLDTAITFGGVNMIAFAQSAYQDSGSTPHVEIWILPEASIPAGAQTIACSPTHSTSRGVMYTLADAHQNPSKKLELGGGSDAFLTGQLTGLAAADVLIGVFSNVASRVPTWPAELSLRYNDTGNSNLIVSTADGTGVSDTYNFSGGVNAFGVTEEQAIALAVFPSLGPAITSADDIELGTTTPYTRSGWSESATSATLTVGTSVLTADSVTDTQITWPAAIDQLYVVPYGTATLEVSGATESATIEVAFVSSLNVVTLAGTLNTGVGGVLRNHPFTPVVGDQLVSAANLLANGEVGETDAGTYPSYFLDVSAAQVKLWAFDILIGTYAGVGAVAQDKTGIVSPSADGKYYASHKNGDHLGGSSGSSGSMSYSAAGGLVDGATVTLSAITADFGTSGPTLQYFERMTDTAIDSPLPVDSNSGVASVSIRDAVGAPEVCAAPDLPNGRGIKYGRKGLALNEIQRFGIDYPYAEEIFEHQCIQWPAANKAIAEAAGLDSQGGAFNLKTTWHMRDNGDSSSNTLFDVFMGTPLWLNPGFSGGEAFIGNTQDFNGDISIAGGMGQSSDFSTDPFVRQMYIKANPVPGNPVGSKVSYRLLSKLRGELVNESTADDVRVKVSGVPTDGVVGYSIYPGYARGIGIDNGAYVIMSEAYIATGPNCQARVQISDTETPSPSSTMMGIQEILSWSSSEITFKLNPSWWHDTTLIGAYLHVYDGTGTFIGSVQL